MKIISTFHQPSSVVASLKCSLAADPIELGHLVVAKTSRVEVSSIQPEGLRHECSLEIWGRVVAMRAVASHVSHMRNHQNEVLGTYIRHRSLLYRISSSSQITQILGSFFLNMQSRTVRRR